MKIFNALKRVFRYPGYIVLAVLTSATAFAAAVWLPNVRLIVEIMRHPSATFLEKATVPLSLLGSITTNFTLLSATYTILIAILIGLNIASALFVIRNRVAEIKSEGIATGMVGILSGVFGIGCAACGTLLLTSILSIVGASWILSYLPLNGGEFGILGVLLLSTSLYMTSRNILNPKVCNSI